MLHVFEESDQAASLDAGWDKVNWPRPTVAGSEDVSVTTLDELNDEDGPPALVKIDAEGFDHRVLRGLSLGTVDARRTR